MNLSTFLDTYKEAIAQRVVASYPPQYRPAADDRPLPPLLRPPLGAQETAIRGTAHSLGHPARHHRRRGDGHRQDLHRHRRRPPGRLSTHPRARPTPPHQEVEAGSRGHHPHRPRRHRHLHHRPGAAAPGQRPRPALRHPLPRARQALLPLAARRGPTLGQCDGRLLRDEATGEPFRVPTCPVCAAQVVTPDGVPLTDAELARRKRTCADCGAALWQADRSGPRRYPLADYVKQRMKGWFDLLIADEVHEYKGRGSAQGIAAGILADVCGTSLALTGTLAGGYASTLFHLLYRFSPALRAEFAHGRRARWIARYGFVEHTVRRPADEALEDGRHSRRRRYRTVIRERPGWPRRRCST